MCELCSDPQKGKERSQFIAAELRRLSVMYSCLADGTIKPHTDKTATIGLMARSMVRILVDEWV